MASFFENLIHNLISTTHHPSSLTPRISYATQNYGDSNIQHLPALLPSIVPFPHLHDSPLVLPFNLTTNDTTAGTLQIVDSVLEYLGVAVSLLVFLFYFITFIMMLRRRKNFFMSLWPIRTMALLGAMIHAFFGGILMPLAQQSWWVRAEINQSTSFDSISMTNNVACRILYPFEFIGFVMITSSLLFVVLHTMTPKKVTSVQANNADQPSSTNTKQNTETTQQNHDRTLSIIDLVISDDPKIIGSVELPLYQPIPEANGDTGSIKILQRSNSSRTRGKSDVGNAQTDVTPIGQEVMVSRPSVAKAQVPPSAQELEKNTPTIDSKKENGKMILRAWVIIVICAIVQVISIIVDVVLSYTIERHNLEFIYNHVTRLGGYCAVPLDTLIIYSTFYIVFFTMFNIYSVRLYKKLINKKLKRRVLACQLIVTSFFLVFGVIGKAGEFLFTILQSINMNYSSLLFDELVRLFNIVNFLGCDILVCLFLVIYFVFIPLLDVIKTEQFYKTINRKTAKDIGVGSVTSSLNSTAKLLKSEKV